LRFEDSRIQEVKGLLTYLFTVGRQVCWGDSRIYLLDVGRQVQGFKDLPPWCR
jgi:hypothetical protein